ncbi:MAG: 2-oxo acid dehydrogenase subunit E2 [Deltaproteobacteria bacterium]|nr:2-oxo acid dehydrogenase subunit E2 [Deltaproteobacteria bacterium]
MSLRRKLAIATWAAPREGNIFGKITLDATHALRYLEELRVKTGEKVTITHLVGKVIGEALKMTPTLNGRILFGGFIPHRVVDVSFLVALENGNDLAKAKVCGIDQKSVVEVGRELRQRVERLRGGKDDEFEKGKGVIRLLPPFLLKPMLWFTGWLTGALGIGAKALGLEAFPFGASIITNVGVFGVDEGFAPQTPFARVPLYVLVGAVREHLAVINGAIVVQPQITLCATLDHRFVDGAQIGTLAKIVREKFLDPWSLDAAAPAPIEAPAGAVAAERA